MGGMNRIRVIAVVLSIVLLILGETGNTKAKVRRKQKHSLRDLSLQKQAKSI